MVDKHKEEFLDEIAETVTEATIRSYRSTLNSFIAHGKELDVNLLDQPIEGAVHYLDSQTDSKAYSTLHGEIASLSNFIAHLKDTNPDVVQVRIYNKFNEISTQSDGGHAPLDSPSKLEPEMRDRIEEFRDRLRQSQYGTRTHAIVELMLTTGYRPQTITQIDLQNYCHGKEAIEFTASKPDESRAWTNETRTIKLPADTKDALDTYIEHERRDCVTAGADPLFTSQFGRVSTATIRRSIKQAWSSPLHGEAADELFGHPASPRHLRYYWLSEK